MSFAWLLSVHDRKRPEARASTADLDAIASIVGGVPGLMRGLVYTPAATRDPYLDDGDPPQLVLQLYFDALPALEAAIAADGALQGLGRIDAIARSGPAATREQAMLVRTFTVPDARLRPPAGELPCSYLVDYPGPAEDLNAWLTHYIGGHPPLMAEFPGIREIEILTRIDWVSGSAWPRADSMLRNRVAFDSAAALTAALNSPVRHALREDFKRFPPFAGGNTHYPMATRTVLPAAR